MGLELLAEVTVVTGGGGGERAAWMTSEWFAGPSTLWRGVVRGRPPRGGERVLSR